MCQLLPKYDDDALRIRRYAVFRVSNLFDDHNVDKATSVF